MTDVERRGRVERDVTSTVLEVVGKSGCRISLLRYYKDRKSFGKRISHNWSYRQGAPRDTTFPKYQFIKPFAPKETGKEESNGLN